MISLLFSLLSLGVQTATNAQDELPQECMIKEVTNEMRENTLLKELKLRREKIIEKQNDLTQSINKAEQAKNTHEQKKYLLAKLNQLKELVHLVENQQAQYKREYKKTYDDKDAIKNAKAFIATQEKFLQQ